MITESEIIQKLDAEFAEESQKHEAHKQRVKSALQWWWKNILRVSENSFLNSILIVNGIECLCTRVDLRGTPYYNATFEVRPMRADEDAGSGAGLRHIISF